MIRKLQVLPLLGPLNLALLCMCVVGCHAQCSRPQPTPRDFESLFLNSCRIAFPEPTCDYAWGNFSAAFAGEAPENVTSRDYNPFFDVLPVVTDVNETLFWSRTSELVMLVSMMSQSAMIQSSYNLPTPTIINRLGDICWCGDPTGGIDYNSSCPSPSPPVTAFIEQFSIELALSAQGTAFWLTFSEGEGGAFRNNSFWSRAELPNLTQRVREVIVLDIHRMQMGEACGEGTLVMLDAILDMRGFEHRCYNVYGNPMGNMTEISALGDCTLDIIAAIQMGQEPPSSDCFSGASSNLLGMLNYTWLIAASVISALMSHNLAH